jgi:sugar phosphate isomerase/epimerase
MDPINYDQTVYLPLTTDSLIEQRVDQLVGRAQGRQLWLMFLDDAQVQLPLLIPMADVPVAPPPDDLPRWASLIENTAEAAGAASVVLVLERYASEQLTDADRSWARQLRDACALAAVPMRAIVLSHRRGARLLAPDDYAG